MKWQSRISVIAAICCVACSALAKTVIVVHSGAHRSPEEAAYKHNSVNWLDADTRDDVICTESFAAMELQHHLQKLTGNFDDFDVISDTAAIFNEDVILVGGPSSNFVFKKYAGSFGMDEKHLSALGPEGYRIKSGKVDGRRVTVVVGGKRVGTLYGAYDLLHRLGYRWFAPGEVNEEIPRISKIPNLDVTEKPSFTLRRLHGFESRHQPGDDLLLWMARNRMNSWCVIEGKTGLMHKLGIQMSSGEHTAEWLFLGPTNNYPYQHTQFAGGARKFPADPYPVSSKFRGDLNKDGKLTYFEAHPEWFPLVSGKRIPGINFSRGHNYCTSNSEATAEFLKNYVQAVVDGIHRDGEVIMFWTVDSGTTSAGKWCECAPCKALGTPTDRYLLLTYQFDKEIKKAQAAGRINRPVAVRFMIYRDVINPPTKPLPADFDYATCTGTFFPAVHCYEHAFADTSCSMNVKFQKQLSGWTLDPKRYYRGPVGIGEYYNVHRFKALPLCFMRSMALDIPYFYRTAGARQFDYMHVTTQNWGNKSLTNWQMARQLWDVNTDCEEMWDDYFAGRYGKAARPMRRFYERLEKVNFNEVMSVLSGQLKVSHTNLFPTSHLRYERKPGLSVEGPTFVEMLDSLKACRKLINQAMSVKSPSRIQSRLAEDERLFTYGENMLLYFDALVKTFETARAGKREDALRHFAEAKRVAELLRLDTTSPKFSWDHVKATNALDASNCAGTLDLLAKLLVTTPTAGGRNLN